MRITPAIEPPMPIASISIAPDKGDVVVTTTDDHGTMTVTGTWPDKVRRCANGTELSGYGPNTVARISAGAPNSGLWSGERVSRYRRGDWNCELRIAFTLRSTASTFIVTEAITALSDGRQIFTRTAARRIRRQLV